MDALIIVAVVLVVAGLLVSVILWLRSPGSADTEYVTVAELQARLEHEQDEPEETADSGDHTAGGIEPRPAATDRPATASEPGAAADSAPESKVGAESTTGADAKAGAEAGARTESGISPTTGSEPAAESTSRRGEEATDTGPSDGREPKTSSEATVNSESGTVPEIENGGDSTVPGEVETDPDVGGAAAGGDAAESAAERTAAGEADTAAPDEAESESDTPRRGTTKPDDDRRS